MKKTNLQKLISVISAAAVVMQFSSLGTVSAADSSEAATKFVFSDNAISVSKGDFTGYKISGTELTINSEGTYEVSGTCSDGNIKVKKGTTGVNLVLDGLTLASEDTAPICFNKSSEATLTAKANTVNKLSDSVKNNDDNYPDNENAENAVIKCKDGSDVIINGSGKITVTANGKNGIKSGASTDEEGSASLTIDGAALDITASVNDAINAEAELNIKSGTLNISAADDAIHSDYSLVIGEQGADGVPVINISECYEGLEGANVKIYSGDIEIHSEDDGINAANSDLSNYGFTLDIIGGDIYIDAEKGDGIDSNGTLTISGGNVDVFSTSDGSNSPLDSDGTFTVTGGTVFAVGNSGMAQTPSAGSQSYITFGAGMGGGTPPEMNNGTQPGTGGNMQPPSGGIAPQNGRNRNMGQMRNSRQSETGNAPQNMQPQQSSGVSISSGDTLSITTAANTAVYNTTAVRSANYVFYSDSALSESETYTLNANGTALATATVSDSAQNSQLNGAPTGNPPAMPGGNSDNAGTPPTPPSGGMPGGGSSAPTSYTAVNTYSSDTTVDGKTVASTGTDENAILVTDGNVVVKNSEITRNSSDSTGGDNSSFYGIGAAALATGGNLYIKDSTITSDAKGGAGVFAYGNGTAYVADAKISTEKDTSGGIHAAGGGTLYAWNLDVTTQGESSAAIRSDRGGGKMVVDGGSYTSNGTGSPAVYSTADIAVNGAELTANGSEAVCIEGLNSLSLYDSTLTGNMKDNEQNDTTWTVIVYQSMSGDSEIGCGKFAMKDGKLVSENGGLFYTTNTESEFYLENVDITAADDSEFFLRATGNNNKRGWGTNGANGADCLFTAVNQQMNGNVIWDGISTLDFYISDGSTLTGAVLKDSTYTGSGYAKLYIDENSAWIVTGDSTVTSLYCAGSIKDSDGKSVSVVKSDGTVLVKGDSEYTVTVEEYSDSADMSGKDTYTEWSSYAIAQPTYFTESTSSSSGSSSSGSSSSGSHSSSGSSSSSGLSSSSGTATKPSEPKFFDDVAKDAWYYDSVKYMHDNGFMNGTSESEFSPELPVTRAMFVTVLYRMEKEPQTDNKNIFVDTDENEYYSAAVRWANANGVVNGVSENEFAPNEHITRAQMAAIVYRYAKYKGLDISANGNAPYSDNADIPEYSRDAVSWASDKGIINGFEDNSFRASENADRAQTAKVFMNLINSLSAE